MLNGSDILRGYTDTIILAQLCRGDSYGYSINRRVQEVTGGELQLKEGTLYTTFRRLEDAPSRSKDIRILKACMSMLWAGYYLFEGKSQEEIRRYVREHYYDMDFTLDGIRKSYRFDVTCQGSVPQAIEAFLEAVSFEDAIRNAISIGGDSDTIAAITGPIAEACFGIPEEYIRKADSYLDDYLKTIVHEIL